MTHRRKHRDLLSVLFCALSPATKSRQRRLMVNPDRRYQGTDDPKILADTKTISGEITAVDEKSLTIQTKAKKAESLTFTLNPDTKKPTNLAVGSKVTVKYQEEASGKVAMTITMPATKKAGENKASKMKHQMQKTKESVQK